LRALIASIDTRKQCSGPTFGGFVVCVCFFFFFFFCEQYGLLHKNERKQTDQRENEKATTLIVHYTTRVIKGLEIE